MVTARRKAGEREETEESWRRSICGPGMLLAVIWMACMTPGILHGNASDSYFDVIWFFIALGLGVGMLLVRFRCLEGWMQPGWVRSEVLCLAACGIAMAGFSYWCGMRQFGGFDQSVVVDAGWRLYSGQKPYTDFICTLPVGFYLGAELAFRWFGVYWSSLIKLNAFYLLLTYFWTYAVLREVFQNKYLAMVLVITCESMSLILASYWWYNPATSMTVSLYVASVAAVLLRPGNRWLWASLCLSLLLTALMKPNVSSVAIFAGTVALLLSAGKLWHTIAVSAIAFVLWLGVVAIHGANIAQVLNSYLMVASHGFTSEHFLNNMSPQEKAFAWGSVFAVLPGLGHILSRKAPFPGRLGLRVLGTGAILASLFGFYGNGDAKLVDLSVGLLATALLMGKAGKSGGLLRIPSKWAAYLVLICSIFTFSSLTEAALRYRVRGIGLGTFFEFQLDPAPIQGGFFDGVTGGYNLHATVDALTDLCASQDTHNIYFGSRLQWAYAAYRIQSPKRMPIWWHPTTAFDPKDEYLLTDRWIDYHFDPVAMMDFSFMNAKLLDSILHTYGLARAIPMHSDVGPLLILRRR